VIRILNKAKRIVTKLFYEDVLSKTRIHVSSNKNSDISGLNIVVRKPIKDRIYLSIGANSLIAGSFIFENENGNITIGDRTFIGGGQFISIENITVGNDVMFSWGCVLMDNNAHSLVWSQRANDVLDWKKGVDEGKVGEYKDWSKVKSAPIIIKDKAWIGFNTIILKGVTVGEGSIIGAGSVVTRDVPDWTIVAGNPAQIIRSIPENER
jgi:acetyltransferase-like isoleucine patch superfamily enzyme